MRNFLHKGTGWYAARYSRGRSSCRILPRQLNRHYVRRTCNIISRCAVCQVLQGRFISHAIWMHRKNTSRLSLAVSPSSLSITGVSVSLLRVTRGLHLENREPRKMKMKCIVIKYYVSLCARTHILHFIR